MPTLLRLALRNPYATLAAIGMTAIGIALGALGIALFDALWWRPLPFSDTPNLVVLFSRHESPREVRSQVNWSYPRARFVTERATSIELAGPWRPASVTLTGQLPPVALNGEFVSPGYFDLLGARPVAGRLFAPDRRQAVDSQPTVVISEVFRERQQLAGNPIAIGSVLQLNGLMMTIIGVMPETFRGLTGNADVWLPISLAPRLTYPEFLTINDDFITLLGRRSEGVTPQAATRELGLLAAEAYRTLPSDDVTSGHTVSGTVVPLSEVRARPEAQRAARLVLAGSLILFLLAMANLAALQMSRSNARRRELAITLAMGASPARLRLMLARDCALPVVAGALLAIGSLAAWLRALDWFDPLGSLGRNVVGTFTAIVFDARLVAWWGLATALALILAVAVPAVWAARRTTLSDLRAGARGSAGAGLSLRRPGTPAVILGVEAALAVMLVIAAAQLLESYRRMKAAPVGVDASQVLTFEIRPSERAVPPASAAAFIDRVLDSVRTVPGVVSASVDGGAPLVGSASTRLHVVGKPSDPAAGPPLVLRHYVGPEHFTTLGVPLLAGRGFTDADRAGAPGVVIISENAARLYFHNGDAIGQRVWFGGSTMTSPETAGEIIGVVGDVKYAPLLGEQTTASFYTPYPQFTYGERVYFVKVAGDPMSIARALTVAVGRVAPEWPLLRLRPLDDLLASSSGASRRAALGTGALAALGLLLAASGIWAVVSHAVSQRTREMAIRMAHGATSGRIMRLVLADGLAWPVAGLAVGLLASVALSDALRSLLYAVRPGDPGLVIAGACAFMLIAAGACLVPACRAARVNPIDTLRAD